MKVKRIKHWKTSTKITVLYLLLSALLLAVLIPAVYFLVEGSLRDSLSANMQISANTIAEAIAEESGNIRVDSSKLDDDAVKPGIYIQVLDAEGNALYSSRDADWIFEVVAAEKEKNKEPEREWSSITQSETVDGQDIQIQVLGSIYFNDFLNDFSWMLLLLVPGYMLLAAIGSMFLAKRALQPIRQISETAKKISVGDLSERIEGIYSKDEVGELADTFNTMLEDLEVSFQRERQFTSDASHELRTPMTVITACVEDAIHTDDPAIWDENIRVIQRENQRMRKIVSQLLMLSRGYEGRCHFQPEELCLWNMAETVCESLSPLAGSKSISIHNEVPQTYMIYADQSLFTQLLVNLVENAIKYGNEGGNIRITSSDDEAHYSLCVEDDGIGISEDDLPKIFERFYRADKARDRTGSGLGLSIVKWIAELHEGNVTAESELGKGTKMTITWLRK